MAAIPTTEPKLMHTMVLRVPLNLPPRVIVAAPCDEGLPNLQVGGLRPAFPGRNPGSEDGEHADRDCERYVTRT